LRSKRKVESMSVEELKKLLDPNNLPRHIAIIMDGNGRWAQKRHLPRTEGHKAAVQSVRETVEICGEIGVEVLTLYSFSTENWKRPEPEVRVLMSLLKEQLRRETDELDRNNVQVRAIGEVDQLPADVLRELERAIERTRDNTGLKLVLALNYGGRKEIARAVRMIADEVKSGRLNPDEIDENLLSRYLYTSDLPDPDLLIRTSGEMRVSNFLLWQIAYTELYITPVLWPDFRKRHLLEAVIDYQRRERRFGGL
jgi:undecaprenyl diphosphate synthase